MSEEQKTSDAKIDWANKDLGVAWGESIDARGWRVDYNRTLPMQHESFLQQFVLRRIRAFINSTSEDGRIVNNAEKAWQRIREIIDAEK